MGPDPAVAATRRAARAVLTGGPVLVACSGGTDSLALAAAVAFEAPRHGVAAGMITVDHGLQDGSAQRAAAVAATGRALGLAPVRIATVTVGTAGGPEAAARTARYAALADAAGEAPVLLGHTRDDQAETVLLGLARGSGPRSIAGMAVARDRWLRPFLGLDRATTRAACAAQGLEPWDDPHNADPRFVRVRLRHEVLPLLEDVLHGGVAAALAHTGDLLRDDLDALDGWASTVAAEAVDVDGSLVTERVAGLPRAVRTRVLRSWVAERAGGEPLPVERTAALDALITHWHGQGAVPLPGGVAVRRTSGRLQVVPAPNVPQE